ncbi:hypothetical protein M758_5G189200 [Ceratodon purpureus]|uniref:T6SS Phospholipase effector Tle1-like catalytic domain-containing protein n=1 Tax=Ceratodon purpureus TaxID=3225 RepID=A0A8T0I3C9_CERPU|nr:hypothetical protein KC19_5G196200 [Ceratodon purpureus]KAG0617426.1 hypothetical protein M758_5G189200 [Ceratodon purpureus]
MPENTKFRRLVLMFDGTWNERHNLTNVARMFEAIDDYKPDKDEEVDPDCEPLQLVKYLKGVGTNKLGSYLGGAFGYGLSDIIKEGYRWLSNNYREGDEIFVFGFSRGAYSARSLVSLVHRCRGVLRRKPGDPEIPAAVLNEAYKLYRGYVETTDGVNANYEKQLEEFSAKHCQLVTVKMLGVWDTVGALGIPDSAFKLSWKILEPLSNLMDSVVPWSRKHYGFHGQGLPCIVENAYHALAIDEHREDFAPTLWDKRKPENKEVKQVWFIGSHCNVGGGATGDEDEDPDDLWQYSYIWMQHKAQNLGLRFYWVYGSGKAIELGEPEKPKLESMPSGTAADRRRVSKTKVQDSYGQMIRGYYAWFHKPFHRDVVNSVGASLHWSVKERIQQDKKYRPKSLLSGPEEQCLTEIPDRPLPEEICSCKKPLHTDTAVTNGHLSKKQS